MEYTAHALHEATRAALAATGLPSWPCDEDDGYVERLVFCGEADASASYWALTLVSSDESALGSNDDAHDCADEAAVAASVAVELIRGFLREFLLARGWQVQVQVSRDARRWRLVDCLSAAAGGGDRLEVDYPYGDDELSVLCASVLAVTSGATV